MSIRKKLIGLSRVVPYTQEELKSLQKILLDANVQSEINRAQNGDPNLSIGSDWTDVRDAIEEYLRDGSIYTDWGESYNWQGIETNDSKELNLMQYLLVYYPKVFILLVCVDKKNVPLYLTRGIYYRAYAEWRLLINK
jgi:hypothetical protein